MQLFSYAILGFALAEATGQKKNRPSYNLNYMKIYLEMYKI